MRVTVLTFGMLRDLPGQIPDSIDLPSGATVGDLLARCRSGHPEPAAIWASIAVAVNREYAPVTHPLSDGDEVALLPPVSGGSVESASPASSHVALTNDPISAAAITEPLKRGEDGALVVFDGIVRHHTRGRRTLYLFYEAYPEMALARMKQLAAQALQTYPVRDVAIVHRLGRLEIGQTSVVIAVASAHRAAGRWLIDTLKQTVPIWKKEFFEDGAVWAQGDPFPPELSPERSR
jgi:molybdopterin synthase catalytic subunit/molybdopterin converting factor small subunit